MIVDANHNDNPWFSQELDEQRLHDRDVMDPALYKHVWEGGYYEQSDAQVFAGKFEQREFEPGNDWDGPYHGLDFGFSQDPTAATKSWVHEDILYVEYELYEKRLELDDTAEALIEAIPDISRHTVRADNARPESIQLPEA